MLARWCSRFVLLAAVSLSWVACAGGGSSADDDDAPSEEGAGGDDSAGGSGGTGQSGASGKGGSSAGKSGSSGNAGSMSFPVGGSAGTGQGGIAGTSNGGAAGSSVFPVGGSGGAPPAKGETGAPCVSAAECNSKQCVEVGRTKSALQVCTQACSKTTPCPSGMHCATLDQVGAVCVPDRSSQCGTCSSDLDCLNQGDRCVTSNGQSYCSQDCSGDGLCPAGTECKSPPGGSSSAKVCVLSTGSTCPCAPNRDKAVESCTKTSGEFTCTGKATCNGATKTLEGCTAPDPSADVCNGKDDNCDGKIDNLPHGSCDCTSSPCTVACEPGFARYPATVTEADGCPCAVDANEPSNGTCAGATGLATITDVTPTSTVDVTGTLSADDDVDWYRVQVNDTLEANTNSYHVRVTFTSNPGDEFTFTVTRGDCAQAATPAITSYDLCMNYQVNPGTKTVRGQSVCANTPQTNVPNCGNSSAQYFVAVQRKTGGAKTCSPYTLHIDAAAGACDQASFDALGDQFGPPTPPVPAN